MLRRPAPRLVADRGMDADQRPPGGRRRRARRGWEDAAVGLAGGGDGIDQGDEKIAEIARLLDAAAVAVPGQRDVEPRELPAMVEPGGIARPRVAQQRPGLRVMPQVDRQVEAIGGEGPAERRQLLP